jgi:hypothetical protein
MTGWLHYEGNEKGPGGGFGVRTGRTSGVFVLDLDLKDGKNGYASLLALAQGNDTPADLIPNTTAVETPTGGIHLYFRLPPGVFVKNSRGLLGEGIDVRGEGGFVVGPGSPHKNGGTYRVFDEEAPLANPPAWLLSALASIEPPPKPVVTHRTIDPDSHEGERAIAWARRVLETAEPAIEGQDGSGRLFHVACRLMTSALPLETLQDLVEDIYNPRCEPPWTPEEITHKIENANDHVTEPRGLPSPGFREKMLGRTLTPDVLRSDHAYTFEPGMRSTAEGRKASLGEIMGDLYDHIEWSGVLKYDTFRNRVIAINPPFRMDAETPSGLSDNDLVLVRAWLEFHGKKISPTDVGGAVEAVARRRCFNPVQDYLCSRVWDEVPRLDRVLPDYFQTPDTPYELAIGPRWFISLVARAMDPGCQADCTLILEGRQGLRKTSAFRALMPDPTWYAESSAGVDSKDFFENLRGVWLEGFDELDSLTRASLTRVKTVLTQTRDRYRKSYGHYTTDYPRACGFCGSTNAETYFNDYTGARRFLPAKVLDRIDTDKIIRDRDPIWAEAYARWKAGEAWHVDTSELETLCEEEQEERLEVDPWEEIVRAWLDDPTKVVWEAPEEEEKGTQVSSSLFHGGMKPYDASRGIEISAVLERAVGKLKGQYSPSSDGQRVGRILRHMGLKRVKVRLKSLSDDRAQQLTWRYVKNMIR